jgi:L-lactate dehydrogenase
MPEIIEAGRVGILIASDPAAQLVAPHGGTEPVYSPNPIAAGIPAGPDGPVILDVSTSVTAAGVVNRHKQAGTPLPGEWLLTKDGEPTDDPGALEEGGSILPLGGPDVGYKGFALGLLVEALTSGLAGFGRADEPSNWGTSVFLQVLNPDAFSGAAALEREMSWLTGASRSAPTRPGVDQVRVPGDRALALRADQLANGVLLDTRLQENLRKLCEEKNIRFPETV